jgi:hypothetical protein
VGNQTPVVSIEAATECEYESQLTPQHTQLQSAADDDSFIDAQGPPTDESFDSAVVDAEVGRLQSKLSATYDSHQDQIKRHNAEMEELRSLCDSMVMETKRDHCWWFCK